MYQKHSGTRAVGPARIFSLIAILAISVPLAIASATALAAAFDRELKAPKALNASELRDAVRDYIGAFEGGSATWIDTLRDDALFEQWARLLWHLHWGPGAPKGPLPELGEYGLTLQADNSYQVDFRRPLWSPLDREIRNLVDESRNVTFMTLAPRPALAQRSRSVERLQRRGFRHRDIETLANYLEDNDYDVHMLHASVAENGPLAATFAERARRRTGPGERIDRDEITAFCYQTYLNRRRASRQWALTLLDRLDRQRQRILISTLTEQITGPNVYMKIGPKGFFSDSWLRKLESDLLSGDYFQRIEADKLKLQKYDAGRREPPE